MNILEGLFEGLEEYRIARKEVLNSLDYVVVVNSNKKEYIGSKGFLITDTRILNFLLGTNYTIESCFCIMRETDTIVSGKDDCFITDSFPKPQL